MELDITGMTSEDIENLRVEKIKNLEVMEQNYAIVKQEEQEIQRQIIHLQAKKQDLKNPLIKLAYLIKKIKHEIKILETLFWQNKRSL